MSERCDMIIDSNNIRTRLDNRTIVTYRLAVGSREMGLHAAAGAAW